MESEGTEPLNLLFEWQEGFSVE